MDLDDKFITNKIHVTMDTLGNSPYAIEQNVELGSTIQKGSNPCGHCCLESDAPYRYQMYMIYYLKCLQVLWVC